MKLLYSFAVAGLLALFACGNVRAQEEDQDADVIAPAPAVNKSMIFATQGSDGAGPEIQVFSSSGDGGMFFASPAMMGSDVFSLAYNEDVQKEIELVDEQLEQLKSINDDFSKRIQSEMKELVDGKIDPGRGKEIGELIKRLNEEKRAKMEGVLLPHQFNRLRQISLQQQMRAEGDANTLVGDKVAEALGLTEEQKKKLMERAEELKKEMDEEIARLKKESREELLGELTREQRAKLEEMMGGAFDLKVPEFGLPRMGERMRRARQGGEVAPPAQTRKPDGDR